MIIAQNRISNTFDPALHRKLARVSIQEPKQPKRYLIAETNFHTIIHHIAFGDARAARERTLITAKSGFRPEAQIVKYGARCWRFRCLWPRKTADMLGLTPTPKTRLPLHLRYAYPYT